MQKWCTCSQCQENKSSGDFSGNQWSKGDGGSRCNDCVHRPVCCGVCHRTFTGQNELDMHMQTHRPRNVACLLCGDKRFASPANAIQHVESGYCRECRGAKKARRRIRSFAIQNKRLHRFLSVVPLLTNGEQEGDVPEFPYQCEYCNKLFRQMGQLQQHLEQKHGDTRSLMVN
jgi:Zinc-finger of C2H2 type